MLLKQISQIIVISLLANYFIVWLPSLPMPFTNLSVLAKTLNAKKVEADELFKKGKRQFDASQFQKALQSWEQSLIIYREIGNRLGVANSLENLGNTHLYLGNYRKVIDYHQQSLVIAKEINYRQGESDSLRGLGNAYLYLGDYRKTIDYHQQSLVIAKTINYRQGESDSLRGLGNTYLSLGDYRKAIDYHQQSLIIAKQIGDSQREVNSLIDRGNTHLNSGEYTQALDYYQKSFTIATARNYSQGESDSLISIGNTYLSLGDYKKAIDNYEKSLAIAKKISDRQRESDALGSMGNAYLSSRKYDKAIENYQKSLTIAKKINNRKGEGNSLTGLGNIYWNQGEYKKAFEKYQESLAIAKKLNNRKGEGISLGNLGNVYWREGEYEKAINYYKQSLDIAKEIGNHRGKIEFLNNLGLALRDSGKVEEAEKKLRDVIKAHENRRKVLGSKDSWKVSIFEEQTRTYRILQEVLVAQKRPQEALLIAERGRSRALMELLVQRVSQKPIKLLIPKTPTLEEIKQIAQQQNATLVEYSLVSERQLYIWVIQPKGNIEFRKIDLLEDISVQKLVTASRRYIGVRGRSENKINPDKKVNQTHHLRQLHKVLIEPIAEFLPKNEEDRIIFIPHQQLFLVPFAALQDANYKYLIEKHTILTAPSIQSLSFTRKHQERIQGLSGTALVVGNPAFSKLKIGQTQQRLEPLPGAEKEAKGIAKLLKTKPILGKKATEKKIVQLMVNAKIIHLATHGLLDDINGVGSPGAIALSPSGNDDGFLTSNEIMERHGLPNTPPLRAELVVLSACDTGRGSIKGEGVIGLSRSFIAAGVPTLLVSLWKVRDSSTEELMMTFYELLYPEKPDKNQQKLDKAQALRQAMLTMLNGDNPDPLDWAAFAIIGEAK